MTDRRISEMSSKICWTGRIIAGYNATVSLSRGNVALAETHAATELNTSTCDPLGGVRQLVLVAAALCRRDAKKTNLIYFILSKTKKGLRHVFSSTVCLYETLQFFFVVSRKFLRKNLQLIYYRKSTVYILVGQYYRYENQWIVTQILPCGGGIIFFALNRPDRFWIKIIANRVQDSIHTLNRREIPIGWDRFDLDIQNGPLGVENEHSENRGSGSQFIPVILSHW